MEFVKKFFRLLGRILQAINFVEVNQENDLKFLHIVLADDDPEDLELFEEALLNEEPSASIRKLSNGKAVIEYLDRLEDENLPCLIVLDYNMPELTGSETLSHIGKIARYQTIPKIIVSTSSAPVHIHECLTSGATDYFVKPNNLHELDRLANRILGFCRA